MKGIQMKGIQMWGIQMKDIQMKGIQRGEQSKGRVVRNGDIKKKVLELAGILVSSNSWPQAGGYGRNSGM